jgi:hypothetical protein
MATFGPDQPRISRLGQQIGSNRAARPGPTAKGGGDITALARAVPIWRPSPSVAPPRAWETLSGGPSMGGHAAQGRRQLTAADHWPPLGTAVWGTLRARSASGIGSRWPVLVVAVLEAHMAPPSGRVPARRGARQRASLNVVLLAATFGDALRYAAGCADARGRDADSG